MKPTIKQAFALYDGDDQGYSHGLPLQICTLSAALKTYPYQLIRPITLIDFDGDIYSLKNNINKNNFIGKIPSFTPLTVYHDYIYASASFSSATVDKYITRDELISYIDKNEKVQLTKVTIIADDEGGVYELDFPNTLTLTPFKITRELAYQNAMSKLTDEEKKILGLV